MDFVSWGQQDDNQNGNRTADGRITLAVDGSSDLSTGEGTWFFLQGIEVDNVKEISGVYVHSTTPRPLKFEYSFSNWSTYRIQDLPHYLIFLPPPKSL